MPIPAASVAPTLEELKAHLNIESADTGDDGELTDKLESAVEVVEGYVGPLDGQTITETYYGCNPAQPILLRRYPVLSVAAVTDSNGTVLDPNTYTVDLSTGRLWLSRWSGGLRGWDFWGPVVIDATVTYATGRTTVPRPITEAVLLVAARLWETQRGNAPGFTPEDGPDGVDPAGLPLLPRHAQEQLAPYLRNKQIA